MNLTRIQELLIEADNERLSYGEISEIEQAYELIPDNELREFRDNASVIDMLIELEDRAKVKTNGGRTVKVELS